jgi:hypothetical protein
MYCYESIFVQDSTDIKGCWVLLTTLKFNYKCFSSLNWSHSPSSCTTLSSHSLNFVVFGRIAGFPVCFILHNLMNNITLHGACVSSWHPVDTELKFCHIHLGIEAVQKTVLLFTLFQCNKLSLRPIVILLANVGGHAFSRHIDWKWLNYPNLLVDSTISALQPSLSLLSNCIALLFLPCVLLLRIRFVCGFLGFHKIDCRLLCSISFNSL